MHFLKKLPFYFASFTHHFYVCTLLLQEPFVVKGNCYRHLSNSLLPFYYCCKFHEVMFDEFPVHKCISNTADHCPHTRKCLRPIGPLQKHSRQCSEQRFPGAKFIKSFFFFLVCFGLPHSHTFFF